VACNLLICSSFWLNGVELTLMPVAFSKLGFVVPVDDVERARGRARVGDQRRHGERRGGAREERAAGELRKEQAVRRTKHGRLLLDRAHARPGARGRSSKLAQDVALHNPEKAGLST
jgi:hypothetical protein